MTATYSGDPGENDKDELRFFVGDTDMEDPLLTDQEIEFILLHENTKESAIVVALERIVHRLANDVSTALGPSRIEAQQRHRHYRELLAQAKEQFTLRSSAVFVGGLSVSGKRSQERNSDRVQPFFSRTMGESHEKPKP